jgi:hypothetical protein
MYVLEWGIVARFRLYMISEVYSPQKAIKFVRNHDAMWSLSLDMVRAQFAVGGYDLMMRRVSVNLLNQQ